MRKRALDLHAAIALGVAALLTGCTASSPPAAPPAGNASKSSPGCDRGTLGMETTPISRQLRKKLALANSDTGALVAEVLAGGPAALAGIRADDIVQQIGSKRISNECDLAEAAERRTCEPVRVVVRRGNAVVEATLSPVDEESFLEKTCRDGVASACFHRADALWSRNRETDRDRALELYETACRSGSAQACADAGLHLADNAGRAAEAIRMLVKSCDLDSGVGCTNLAFFYATGNKKLVARDDRRAVRLYTRACELGDPQGCYNVGLMAEQGRGGSRDISRAVSAYSQACDLGSSAACTNLGFLYENGRGVKKDASRALALYQRGCDGTPCQPSNLNGCVNLGRAYRDGKGVARDEARAAAVFQAACDRKTSPDDVDANENRSRGCSLLGALYLAGDGIPRDLVRGRELSQLGCASGDSFGCFNAATVYAAGSGVEKDSAKAASFLDQACKAGDGEGCHDLAVAYEKGTGVGVDRRRAAELFRKACQLGFEAACARNAR